MNFTIRIERYVGHAKYCPHAKDKVKKIIQLSAV